MVIYTIYQLTIIRLHDSKKKTVFIYFFEKKNIFRVHFVMIILNSRIFFIKNNYKSETMLLVRQPFKLFSRLKLLETKIA